MAQPEGPNADKVYTLERAAITPELDGRWNSAAWRQAETCRIGHFHAASSAHRPRTRARLLYDAGGIYVIFDVDDRYVRCAEAGYQAPVCRDSCVEFFVQPRRDRGYLNFEINCGGHLLLKYNEQESRQSKRYEKRTDVARDVAQGITIYHSMPGEVLPERAQRTHWCVEYFVPFGLFEEFLGDLGEPGGQTWWGNLYKCADESSHPHWAAWAAVGEELNFHRPEFFGRLRFAP